MEFQNHGDTYIYDGVSFSESTTEDLEEEVGDGTGTYKYVKLNGTKYYLDGDETEGEIFYFYNNGTKRIQESTSKNRETYSVFYDMITNNNSAYGYYKEACEFTSDVKGLGLTTADAVDEFGAPITAFGNYNIFTRDNDGTPMEEPTSNFNQHRLAIIRYTIEKNLSIAIANYNKYSGTSAYFRMPNLQEDK